MKHGDATRDAGWTTRAAAADSTAARVCVAAAFYLGAGEVGVGEVRAGTGAGELGRALASVNQC